MCNIPSILRVIGAFCYLEIFLGLSRAFSDFPTDPHGVLFAPCSLPAFVQFFSPSVSSKIGNYLDIIALNVSFTQFHFPSKITANPCIYWLSCVLRCFAFIPNSEKCVIFRLSRTFPVHSLVASSYPPTVPNCSESVRFAPAFVSVQSLPCHTPPSQ